MNKWEKTLERLDDMLENTNWFDSNDREDIEMLVERATLKKVILMETTNKDYYIAYCDCDYELNYAVKMPFCPNCGQALDWTDNNE